MLNFDLLFVSETSTDIAWRLVGDTGIVSLARFPTSRAIIVCIEWIAEVMAFRRFWFELVWWEDIFTAIKKSESERGKLTETLKIQRILILCFPKFYTMFYTIK